MYKINLSEIELLELKKLEKKHQKEHKIMRRLRCIRRQHENISATKIKENLGVCADSITDRTKIYIEGGFEALCDLHYAGRRKSVYAQHEDAIRKMIEDNMYNSYIELWDAVERKFDVGNKKDSLYKFCKKKGIPATKNVI